MEWELLMEFLRPISKLFSCSILQQEAAAALLLATQTPKHHHLAEDENGDDDDMTNGDDGSGGGGDVSRDLDTDEHIKDPVEDRRTLAERNERLHDQLKVSFNLRTFLTTSWSTLLLFFLSL